MIINTGSGQVQHHFAFFITSIGTLDSLSLRDKRLVHRIKTVLRLNPGDQCTLFDDQYSVEATIVSYDTQSITFSLHERKAHTPLRPTITWLLPLLKKDAFEQALYSLTELGVTTIQPIITEKAHRSWGSDKDYARAHTRMIAAADQAKQFSIPKLLPILKLTDVPLDESIRIFFDAQGVPIAEGISQVKSTDSLIVCSGPEGDLTSEEKEYLKAASFIFCALTPTVLRAQQAVAVGLGILRSFL